jgi:hypothetical protein
LRQRHARISQDSMGQKTGLSAAASSADPRVPIALVETRPEEDHTYLQQ